MFTAATVPVEREGDTSPLLEAAYEIGKPSTDKPDEETGHPQQQKSAEPTAGSFEKIMATFGRNPGR